MEWYEYLLFVGVGFVAGIINTLAGGGSLLTLPLLMFFGLEANVANATNRIAIILQNIVGVASFKKKNVLNFKLGFHLAIPALIGSVIGAFIAVEIDEDMMKKTIGALLVIMFFIILYKPDKWIKKQAGLTKAKPTILQIIIFFFIGLYGGFIQAGVGFFLLAALVLSVGLDLVKANAVKLLIILFFNLVAITIFLISGIVNLKVGFVLAIGNMLGALVGTQIAVSWGPKFVRIILLTTLVISAIKLLGIYDYLAPILNLPA